MSVYDRLATSVPVNRGAALVTSGGRSNDTPTWWEQREDLKVALRRTELLHQATEDEYEKLKLAERINALCWQLGELKKIKPPQPRDFANFIVDVLKPRFTQAEWYSILEEAHLSSQSYSIV